MCLHSSIVFEIAKKSSLCDTTCYKISKIIRIGHPFQTFRRVFLLYSDLQDKYACTYHHSAPLTHPNRRVVLLALTFASQTVVIPTLRFFFGLIQHPVPSCVTRFIETSLKCNCILLMKMIPGVKHFSLHSI